MTREELASKIIELENLLALKSEELIDLESKFNEQIEELSNRITTNENNINILNNDLTNIEIMENNITTNANDIVTLNETINNLTGIYVPKRANICSIYASDTLEDVYNRCYVGQTFYNSATGLAPSYGYGIITRLSTTTFGGLVYDDDSTAFYKWVLLNHHQL